MTERPEACPRCGYVLVQPPPPPPTYLPPVAPYPASPPGPPARSGLSAASVPRILLGLGATCLLVAAVIFLAVAWSWLGVGGRTAVLVTLTAAAALGGQLLARRDLGLAADALTTVALGLVALDLYGARRAAWLGSPDDEAFLAVVGLALLVVSLALCVPARRLVAPQVAAPLGLGLAVLGAGADTGHPQVVAGAAVLASTALALLGRRLETVVLPWTATAGALLALGGLTSLAVTDALAHPTLHGLWLEGHGLGTVAVAGLVLLPWAVVRDHDELRQLVCALSVSALTWVAAVPALDEGATVLTLSAAAGTVLWSVVAAAAPPRWSVVPRVPLAGSVLVLLPAPAVLAAQGLSNLFAVGAPFTADASVRLDPATPLAQPFLLPLAAAVVGLAALLALPRGSWPTWPAACAAVAAGLLTAALHPLPLWVFVAVLGPLGLVVATPSAVLTLLVLAEVVLLAAALLVRRATVVEPAAALVLPLALAAFLWTGGHVLDVPYEVRSLVTLGVLGLLAIAVPRVELEIGAAVAVVWSSVAGVDAAADASVMLAVHLTLAGAVVTTTALVHRDRRPLAWLGGLLLAAATWVRLYDVGVEAPEAYTLPTAVALVLVGGLRLLRDPDADTRTTLVPGLALATVPSLLWVLVDPVSTRAVLLGLGCLALLLAGVALRWSAPVVVGGLVGGTLVLRELAPYAATWPQWALIGVAGTLLLGVGITWEARLRDLRRTAVYLGRLR